MEDNMMKKPRRLPNHRLTIILCLLSLILMPSYSFAESSSSQSPAGEEADVKGLVSNIHWLGHDSFRIEGDGIVIYIDPWQVSGGPKADLILITHDHQDHCSPADVDKLKKQDTVIVTIADAAAKLSGSIRVVKPGDELTVEGIPISTVPAYNLNKFRSPGVPFHPREAGHVGFVFAVEGCRIYHAGDTDNIPEMAGIDVDVALLPVSGIYVMTADEAVGAAERIKPKVAIPMHVGRGIGSLTDTESFKEKASVPVEILPIEK
jgi:L-ascorbate metabolism protein UlaG (beta-lactamase superfamily)